MNQSEIQEYPDFDLFNSIVLSIKPGFAKDIYDGKKKFEFRKQWPLRKGSLAFLYETDGKNKISGFISYDEAHKLQGSRIAKGGQDARIEENLPEYLRAARGGYAVELKERVQFKEPLPLALIRQIEPEFTVPRSFCYLSRYKSLFSQLSSMVIDIVNSGVHGFRLCEIHPNDYEEFRELVLDNIGRQYDDIDESFAKHIFESTIANYDKFGYFTIRKNVYKIIAGRKKIGYTTITEKRGGSVKTGPTVFFQRHRHKGYGQSLRKLVEQLYALKGYRKVYCTCPDTNIEAYNYLVRAGYKIEAHLKEQYKTGQNEIIFGKLLCRPKVRSFRIRRTSNPIIRISTKIENQDDFNSFLRRNFGFFYLQADDSFIRGILAALRRYEKRDYYLKGKKVFCGYGEDLNSVVICSPKRGASVKLSPVIMTRDRPSIEKLVFHIERYFKRDNNRKVYLTLPIYDTSLYFTFIDIGYEIEGVLRSPYQDGIDMVSLGKNLS